MGGHLSSCMYAGTSSPNQENEHNSSTPGVLKVVLACEGRTCEFSEPVKVAELMLEFPNHFVAEYDTDTEHSRSAAGAGADAPMCSKRVSPLPADQDAKLCHVYILLPMHRLNTRLSTDELDLISALAAAPTASSATPQCIALSYAKAAHSTSSKITPLSARHYQEAATSWTTTTTSSSSNGAIAKSYSVPIFQLLEEVASIEDVDNSEPDNNNNSATQGQHSLHILRSKSWTPKLETIIESLHL